MRGRRSSRLKYGRSGCPRRRARSKDLSREPSPVQFGPIRADLRPFPCECSFPPKSRGKRDLCSFRVATLAASLARLSGDRGVRHVKRVFLVTNLKKIRGRGSRCGPRYVHLSAGVMFGRQVFGRGTPLYGLRRGPLRGECLYPGVDLGVRTLRNTSSVDSWPVKLQELILCLVLGPRGVRTFRRLSVFFRQSCFFRCGFWLFLA